MLEHIVRRLAACGFTDICCTLACLPDQIRRYYGDGGGFGVHMEYRLEERALGTAGAVKNCADFTRGEDFLVISGDAACDLDLRALWDAHRRARPAVTMALHPHDAPTSYGLVVTDADGYVRSFLEKPPWEQVVTNLVNTGIYVMGGEAMAFVPAGACFDFAKDLFPRLLHAGLPLLGVPLEGYWRDIGDPGSYYRANLDAWEGTLHLPEAGGEEKDAASPEMAPRYACRVYWQTPRRARLMRAFTAGLMEAGADLSDGLRLENVPGGVHIAPCGDREALCIESDDPDTLRRFQALAGTLEARMDRESRADGQT